MSEPLNPYPGGTARTIKENYHKVSLANFIRRGGTFAQTGVIEYELPSEENHK